MFLLHIPFLMHSNAPKLSLSYEGGYNPQFIGSARDSMERKASGPKSLASRYLVENTKNLELKDLSL